MNIPSCSGCLLLKYIFLPNSKANKAKRKGEVEQKGTQSQIKKKRDER